MLLCAILVSGCNLVGFLANPGPYERKVPPEYNLVSQQDRNILFLLECPRSSGVSVDVKDKLSLGFQVYLTSKMGIKSESIIYQQADRDQRFVTDPVEVARELGAGLVLLVQVDNYQLELINTTPKKYFTGQMISRAILMDADLGMTVWPKDTRGKMVEIGVDLEMDGRDEALSRLIVGTTHCILRHLYPCDKLKYKNSDEVFTLQEAFEMEI